MTTHLSRLASLVSLFSLAALAACAAPVDEETSASADAVTAFPSECPQFAKGHVVKGSWGGQFRECVIERCAPGWANAEANDGASNPRMKGRYETGILGMADDQKDGCETRLSSLVAARSTPGVENLGELAGDESDARPLEASAIGNHVYRVRMKEAGSGLPKALRLNVNLTHYASMAYRLELSSSRAGAAATACSGEVVQWISNDPEHDKSWKAREENKALDFSDAAAVTDFAGFETRDVPARDDTIDVFIKVTLTDAARATALGNPGFHLEVEQDDFRRGELPLRCEP